ncbi:unnamed protein product, partial [Didymodactylos carnosus]
MLPTRFNSHFNIEQFILLYSLKLTGLTSDDLEQILSKISKLEHLAILDINALTPKNMHIKNICDKILTDKLKSLKKCSLAFYHPLKLNELTPKSNIETLRMSQLNSINDLIRLFHHIPKIRTLDIVLSYDKRFQTVLFTNENNLQLLVPNLTIFRISVGQTPYTQVESLLKSLPQLKVHEHVQRSQYRGATDIGISVSVRIITPTGIPALAKYDQDKPVSIGTTVPMPVRYRYEKQIVFDYQDGILEVYTRPYFEMIFNTHLYNVKLKSTGEQLDQKIYENVQELYLVLTTKKEKDQITKRQFVNVNSLVVSFLLENISCLTFVDDLAQLITLSNLSSLSFDGNHIHSKYLLVQLLDEAPNITSLTLDYDLLTELIFDDIDKMKTFCYDNIQTLIIHSIWHISHEVIIKVLNLFLNVTYLSLDIESSIISRLRQTHSVKRTRLSSSDEDNPIYDFLIILLKNRNQKLNQLHFHLKNHRFFEFLQLSGRLRRYMNET